MDHHQIEKNGMYQKMLIFFANPINAAVWASFARLVNEIVHFVSLNNSLTNYLQQQNADIKGITQTKNDAFMAMVNIIVNKAAKAYVWAVDASNATLMQIFDVQKSDFDHISETKAYNQIKNIRDALSDNIASMDSVQLTDADVANVSEAIMAYENTIGTPGAAQTHKTEGTKAIDAVMVPIDKSLALIDKLIVSSYTASQPDMVKEYLANRVLDKLPTHHSGLSIHITDAETGADLEGAILAVNGKTATSDIDGIAEIIKIMPGTYNMSVTLADYVTQTTKIVIEKGRVTELDVKMIKA